MTIFGLFLLILSASAKINAPDSPCSTDIADKCPQTAKNEMSSVMCLQREIAAQPSAVSRECQNEIWKFKNNLVKEQRFIDQAKKICSDQLASKCPTTDDVLGCLIEHRLEIMKGNADACPRFISQVAELTFSDYHLVKGFLESCSEDVSKLQCGVIANDPAETETTQSKVISCLERKIRKVSDKCRGVLEKKEEEAADSFKLDKALYLACRGDRDFLCSDTPDSAGSVYRCLGNFKFDKRLSADCRSEIVRRQLMVLGDYKVDYNLMTSCGNDLVVQHCIDDQRADQLSQGFMRTVLLLQCLSDAGTIDPAKRIPVSPRCLQQVHIVKRMIMGDIELSPGLGLTCHNDVNMHCANVPPNQEGGVIKCLMDLAASKDALEPQCQETVLQFVEVVDPVRDYKLNYALMENCGDYISDHCEMEQGEGEVMKCMIDLEMILDVRQECHLQILSYKYFMSRSIKLDAPLLKACREDAQRLCQTEFEQRMKGDHKPHGGVISCLYHHIFMTGENRLTAQCEPELKRAIIGQGESVNLSPNIVSACTQELIDYCSGTEPNKDDYGCLQKHLVDPEQTLGEQCAKEVMVYSQLVADDVRNDYRLMKACRNVISSNCRSEMATPTHGNLLHCLIEHKGILKGSCEKQVKALQLVSLHDFKFNPKFVKECGAAVQELCKSDPKTGRPISKKQDVMYCLREKIMSQKAGDPYKVPSLTTQCKAQLKQEFLKQMSDLDLDPKLVKECNYDLRNTCKLDQMADQSEVMECLRRNERTLAKGCRDVVFERELQQAEDPGLDAVLFRKCGNAIGLYCSESRQEDVLTCLESHLHKQGVTADCRKTVKQRMKKEHADYRLNPALAQACDEDIKALCGSVLGKLNAGTISDGEGAVISCLKDHMSKVSVTCEDQITILLEQEVSDYELDPILVKRCHGDIKAICPNRREDEVEGCLRDHISDIKSIDCTKQVIRLVAEAHGDVHLDPVLLRACQEDISYVCPRSDHGKGQIIECLQATQKRDKSALSHTCSSMLDARLAMWSEAFKRAKEYDSALEMVDDLYQAIESSKHKHELLAYFLLSVIIIVTLSFCGGRWSKPKPTNKLY